MKSRTVSVKLKEVSRRYEIEIGSGLLTDCGAWAKDCLPGAVRKTVVISNPKIFRLCGEAARASLEKAGFEVFVWLMKDGEKHKNFRSLENALNFFNQNKVTRTDAVVALGGGVVGDLAGFAAAAHLRGIAFLQIPTTLLAMIDSSVGGKTAVNSRYGKNLIGAFHQPNGILIDIDTLKTLPARELTAGFCEAVKQGAVADRKLFLRTAEFLQNFPLVRFKTYFSDENFLKALINLIKTQVAFKAEIVRQDEKENAARGDAKSRKILNFGHTLAHALEKVTDYKYFKHGEAVGYGILYAAELSKKLDIFDENELKSLNDVVGRVGNLPAVENIDLKEVFEAFKFDKKSDGKSLQWVLLKDIGKPVIISDEHIPEAVIREALKKILHR